MSLTGLILAAGNGKRMQSDRPKVLHEIAGLPMVEWVVKVLLEISVDEICLILSPDLKPFNKLLEKYPDINVSLQEEANGTAGAVACSQFYFEGSSPVSYAKGKLYRGKRKKTDSILICAGDIPGIDPQILKSFLSDCYKKNSDMGILGMRHPYPQGYGRLVCSAQGHLRKIVEDKDADKETKKIDLCNTGVLFSKLDVLFETLSQIEKKNAQGEYYLTDCIQIAVEEGKNVSVFISDAWESFQGVNDKQQLTTLDKWMRTRIQRKG